MCKHMKSLNKHVYNCLQGKFVLYLNLLSFLWVLNISREKLLCLSPGIYYNIMILFESYLRCKKICRLL